jgi:hypothetical protein
MLLATAIQRYFDLKIINKNNVDEDIIAAFLDEKAAHSKYSLKKFV